MTITLYELAGTDPARPFSPHCWKVVLALAHKGLEFDRVAVPFTGVPEVENHLGKIIPVLRDGDRVLNDSFNIALYLDEAYPDRPSLFGGGSGPAHARFVEAWALTQLHTAIGGRLLIDIHDRLDTEDQIYFRHSRETRFGKTLEEVVAASQQRTEELSARLEPMRVMIKHQPFIGGDSPLFVDYIVFGAFQWARVCSPQQLLSADDPVNGWFERCLDLHGAVGRAVAAAA
ncbi:MAG: glutathione S-transferase family protein [Pseudomonadota bacterium]